MLSLRFIFMIFFTPTAMFMGVTKPFAGLCMLIFLYYFRPEVWGAPEWFRPIQFITLAVTVGWLLNIRTFKCPPVMVLALLTLAAALLTVFSPGAHQETVIDGVSVLYKLILVMFLTVQFVDTPGKLNAILWINVIGMIWNLKTIIVSGGDGLDRVNVGVGQGGGANYLAMILVMHLPFLLLKAQKAPRKERLLALALIPLYALSLVFTGSRGGILAMVLVMIFMVLRSTHRVAGLGLVGAVALIVAVSLPQAQWDRFKQGFGASEAGELDGSAEIRLTLWKAGMKMFGESMLMGKGYLNYSLLSPRYSGIAAGRTAQVYIEGKQQRGFMAHSTWVQSLAEGGLLKSIPFFAMFLAGLWGPQRVLRMRLPPALRHDFKVYATSVQGMIIAFMVCATFGNYIQMDFLWWYMGIAGAIPIVARRAILADEAARRMERDEAEPASGPPPGPSRRSPPPRLPARPARAP